MGVAKYIEIWWWNLPGTIELRGIRLVCICPKATSRRIKFEIIQNRFCTPRRAAESDRNVRNQIVVGSLTLLLQGSIIPVIISFMFRLNHIFTFSKIILCVSNEISGINNTLSQFSIFTCNSSMFIYLSTMTLRTTFFSMPSSSVCTTLRRCFNLNLSILPIVRLPYLE